MLLLLPTFALADGDPNVVIISFFLHQAHTPVISLLSRSKWLYPLTTKNFASCAETLASCSQLLPYCNVHTLISGYSSLPPFLCDSHQKPFLAHCRRTLHFYCSQAVALARSVRPANVQVHIIRRTCHLFKRRGTRCNSCRQTRFNTTLTKGATQHNLFLIR